MLGNLDAKRDWGFAPEYVEGMWRIMQHDEPDDFVLATGKTHSVREFVELAFSEIGIDVSWTGSKEDEEGIDVKTGKTLVAIDPNYYRPTEVDLLLGDPTKAKTELGWEAKTSLEELANLMIEADMKEFEK